MAARRALTVAGPGAELLGSPAEASLPPRFRLGRELGRGGFGVVWEALDTASGEMVAIKRVPRTGAAEGDVEAEISVLSSLRHPNVIRLFDHYASPAHIYIVMELVEGGSLAAAVKRFGAFSEALAGRFVAQILAGLSYLHSEGVVHFDVKAGNCLVNKQGVIKLADFGVAARPAPPPARERPTSGTLRRSLSAALPRVGHGSGLASSDGGGGGGGPGAVSGAGEAALRHQQEPQTSHGDATRSGAVGSPYWMAPEVIEMRGGEASADIWSVGATTLELVCGAPPYFHLPPLSAMFHIVADEAVPLPPGISGALQRFLEACFQKDPGARPTARALLEHPWLSGTVEGGREPEGAVSSAPHVPEEAMRRAAAPGVLPARLPVLTAPAGSKGSSGGAGVSMARAGVLSLGETPRVTAPLVASGPIAGGEGGALRRGSHAAASAADEAVAPSPALSPTAPSSSSSSSSSSSAAGNAVPFVPLPIDLDQSSVVHRSTSTSISGFLGGLSRPHHHTAAQEAQTGAALAASSSSSSSSATAATGGGSVLIGVSGASGDSGYGGGSASGGASGAAWQLMQLAGPSPPGEATRAPATSSSSSSSHASSSDDEAVPGFRSNLARWFLPGQRAPAEDEEEQAIGTVVTTRNAPAAAATAAALLEQLAGSRWDDGSGQASRSSEESADSGSHVRKRSSGSSTSSSGVDVLSARCHRLLLLLQAEGDGGGEGVGGDTPIAAARAAAAGLPLRGHAASSQRKPPALPGLLHLLSSGLRHCAQQRCAACAAVILQAGAGGGEGSGLTLLAGCRRLCGGVPPRVYRRLCSLLEVFAVLLGGGGGVATAASQVRLLTLRCGGLLTLLQACAPPLPSALRARGAACIAAALGLPSISDGGSNSGGGSSARPLTAGAAAALGAVSLPRLAMVLLVPSAQPPQHAHSGMIALSSGGSSSLASGASPLAAAIARAVAAAASAASTPSSASAHATSSSLSGELDVDELTTPQLSDGNKAAPAGGLPDSPAFAEAASHVSSDSPAAAAKAGAGTSAALWFQDENAIFRTGLACLEELLDACMSGSGSDEAALEVAAAARDALCWQAVIGSPAAEALLRHLRSHVAFIAAAQTVAQLQAEAVVAGGGSNGKPALTPEAAVCLSSFGWEWWAPFLGGCSQSRQESRSGEEEGSQHGNGGMPAAATSGGGVSLWGQAAPRTSRQGITTPRSEEEQAALASAVGMPELAPPTPSVASETNGGGGGENEGDVDEDEEEDSSAGALAAAFRPLLIAASAAFGAPSSGGHASNSSDNALLAPSLEPQRPASTPVWVGQPLRQHHQRGESAAGGGRGGTAARLAAREAAATAAVAGSSASSTCSHSRTVSDSAALAAAAARIGGRGTRGSRLAAAAAASAAASSLAGSAFSSTVLPPSLALLPLPLSREVPPTVGGSGVVVLAPHVGQAVHALAAAISLLLRLVTGLPPAAQPLLGGGGGSGGTGGHTRVPSGDGATASAGSGSSDAPSLPPPSPPALTSVCVMALAADSAELSPLMRLLHPTPASVAKAAAYAPVLTRALLLCGAMSRVPEAASALLACGAIPAVTALLERETLTAAPAQQLAPDAPLSLGLTILFNLCRLTPERQVAAAKAGVVPPLQRLVTWPGQPAAGLSSAPFSTALSLLCALVTAGPEARRALWAAQALHTLVGVLGTTTRGPETTSSSSSSAPSACVAARAAALAALADWAALQPLEVDAELVTLGSAAQGHLEACLALVRRQPSATTATGSTTSSLSPDSETLLPSLVALLGHCPRLSAALAASPPFVAALVAALRAASPSAVFATRKLLLLTRALLWASGAVEAGTVEGGGAITTTTSGGSSAAEVHTTLAASGLLPALRSLAPVLSTKLMLAGLLEQVIASAEAAVGASEGGGGSNA